MPAEKGTNGTGQRMRMDDGTGYTTWSYDARGRVSEVYQSITGGGNFRTQWGYNSADLPVWMTYPENNGGTLGETVNYTYNNQMLLDRVYGASTYVDDTWYDAAGRITLRELGYGTSNHIIGQTYTYSPWTQQGGRLQSLQSGIPSDQDSLQSLSYNYDAVGNVETISDYHATSNPSDPQVQAFGYDDLDRLINAQATNGETNGRYPQESYGYNGTTGNMVTNAGMDYAYTYPNAPAGVTPVHGVRQVTGGIGYNGTVTIRAKRGTGCTTMPVMKLYINGTLREQWTVNKNSYLNYSVPTSLTTDTQVDVVFSNATSGCTLQVDYVTFPTATGTRTVQAESSGTIFDRGAEAGAPGANAFDGVNVINGAELMTETGSLRFVVGLNALAAGYDANGNMTLRLKDGARYFLAYDAESRLTSVSGTVSASFVYNGDGQRVTATIGATITTYIGGHFEWQGSTGKSYYFAGGQRIAMRTGTEVKFLLGDHLGSTSVTALASGAFDTETRYYPWGGVRWASGTTPTDYRFTGQQEIASIGLYFYNSRFYDASLGRFISPDSIIPNPGDPVSFDHFAYVRNNPLKYSDPSGYFSEDQIKLFMGFDEDDPWEYVLRLFEEGGIYAGRWGWLETLRRAEIGDQISIEWAEGILPEGHPALDGPLTFGLDPQGNLILSGDGFFFGHKLAGLYGDQYNLVHYTDLSAFLCSPYQCGYTTGFSTAAVHDPYLHTRIKWEEFQNLGTDLELLEFISHAAVPAVMTGLLVAETIAVCTNPITCIAGVPPLLSGAYASGWATWALSVKTYEFFMNEYTEMTP